MYVCMYVCVSACIRVRRSICEHENRNAYVWYTHMYVDMYVYMHAESYVNTRYIILIGVCLCMLIVHVLARVHDLRMHGHVTQSFKRMVTLRSHSSETFTCHKVIHSVI